MNRVFRAACTAVVLGAAMLGCRHAVAADPFVIVGPGSAECGKLIELRQSFDRAGQSDEFDTAIAAYAQGFWSGLNYQRRASGDAAGLRALGTSPDEIARELMDRCAGDPGTPLFTQLWLMFNEFSAAETRN